jgi:prophage antirepressor-like protein
MELINLIDETILFNNDTVRIIGTYNEPWFIAKDICKILGIANVTESLRNIPEKWRGSEILSTSNGNQNMNIINESALYKLIMRSNKPIAQKFQEHVCEVILPSIRKQGEYKLQSIIDKNKELEEEKLSREKELQFKEYLLTKTQLENKKLEKKLEVKKRQKYELTNSVYIISNPTIKSYKKDGKTISKDYYKLGKSGDMNNRLGSYGPGAPKDYVIEHSRKLYSKMEETAVEKFMLSIFDSKRCINEIDKPREWIEGIELNIVKNELNLVVDFLHDRKKYYDSQDIKNSIDIECTEKENEKDIKKSIDIECEEKDIEEYDNDSIEIDNNVYELQDEKEENSDIKPQIIHDVINPRDFEKFITECCEVDKDKPNEYFTPKCDLREAHRVWARCVSKEVKKELEQYLKDNFKSGAKFINNSKRDIYRGLKLKKCVFTPSDKNLDFEQFIKQKCVVEYKCRISYNDFYKYFEEFKCNIEPNYKLSLEYKKEIRKYIDTKFVPGRVYISSAEKSAGVHGVWGLGVEDLGCGLKIAPRKNKKVGVYDAITNELLQVFDSISLASDQLKIPFSSLSSHISFSKNIDNKLYKLII